MKILFAGDYKSINAVSWLTALKETDSSLEIEKWRIHSNSRLLTLIKFIFSPLLLYIRIRKIKPNILVSYRTTSYGFIAALTGFSPMVVAVQGETDLWPYNKFTLPLKRMLKKITVKRASLIHAWGENMIPSLIEHGADPDKILQLPRGINIEHFEFVKEKKEQNILITTRSIHEEYNHYEILQAIKILKDQNIYVKWLIIGDGSLKDFLIKSTKELELEDRVTFFGRKGYADIPSFLQKSDIYISTPRTEGTSASLFEAMACGCLPVVSDLPANRAWVSDGKNGFIVPDNKPESIADTIKKAIHLNNKEEILIQNRSLIEKKASLQINMKVFLDHYKKLISSN